MVRPSSKTINLFLLAVIAGLIYFFLQQRGAEKALTSANIAALSDSVRYYKGANGDLIAQKKSLQADNQSIEDLLDAAGAETDQLKKQVGNLKRVVNYYKGEAKLVDTVKVYATDTLIQVDSVFVPFKTFNYSNNFLSIDQGRINLQNNLVTIPYTYSLEFENVLYWKRRGLFKSPELVVDFKFSDPNLIIQEQNNVYKAPQKKIYERGAFKLILGGAVGYFLGTKTVK